MYTVEGHQEDTEVCALRYILMCLVVANIRMHALTTLRYTIPRLTQYSADLVKLLPTKSDPWELLGSQFKVGTKLGEGNYGLVYKGTLSMDITTAPAQRHKDTMTREGKCPYTVAIKLLKGARTYWIVEWLNVLLPSHAC